MKVVYVIHSLATKGGAERIISEKMNCLASLDGYDISVITCYQDPEVTPNCYNLSDGVRQIHLRIPFHRQYHYSYPMRFWIKWKNFRQTRVELQKAIDDINPDIIIGLGHSFADLVCRIKCRAAIIIESHGVRRYLLSDSIRKTPIPRIFSTIFMSYYLHTIEKHADVVVTLTKGDALEWRKARRVEVIPNFSTMPISQFSDCESKRVIAVGRLEWQKGFDRLIKIWAIVSKEHPDWCLDIFGEGTLETDLRKAIQDAQLNNISILPFTQKISMEYANSSILVQTSRFEGFSLALLEAVRHGLPCITFDYPYGPRDLIDNGENGYIIEDDNIKLFADRLCYLMEHHELRKQFAAAGVKKAQLYHTDVIMKQWQSLFDSLT